MLKASGAAPIPSRIGQHWRELEMVCFELHGIMNPRVLSELQSTPGTFALCEGLCRNSTGYLWWDGGWVWERWHWNRWPVEVMRGTLAEIAHRIGASVPESFRDPSKQSSRP